MGFDPTISLEGIISLFSLGVALLVAGYNIKSYFDKKGREELSHAPNFIIDSLVFDPKDCTFPDSYSEPDALHFLFGKRTFYVPNENKKEAYCLVFDVRPDSSNDKNRLICFDKVTIRNNGFDAQYLEIESIDIEVPNETIHLKAASQNAIHYRIDKSNPLELFLSMICPNNSVVFNVAALNNPSFIDEKIEETNKELLNARFERMADKWKKITIHTISKNIYNETYSQDLILEIKNATYLSDNDGYPKLIKKR